MRTENAPEVSDGLLCNLSEGGALVACRRELLVHDTVHLTLHMPGGGDIRILSIVARTGRFSDDSQFVGLEFARVDRQSGSIIEEFIRSEGANRNSRAVLVADDSPARLRQVSELLITRGYRPLLASTFLQATIWVETEPEALVLALVGPRLLSGTGEALLTWLHETHPALHRALLSDHFSGTQLQHTLDRVARERSPTTPWEIG
jgi:CheY-like chemotaxis protein